MATTLDLFCRNSEASRLQTQAQERILEAEKLYSDTCLDILKTKSGWDYSQLKSWDRILKASEKASSNEDIRQASRTEEALIESDA